MSASGPIRRWMRESGLSGVLLDLYATYRLSGGTEIFDSRRHELLHVAESTRDVIVAPPLYFAEACGYVVKQMVATAYYGTRGILDLGTLLHDSASGLANLKSAFSAYADSWSTWHSFLHNVESYSSSGYAPLTAASINVGLGVGLLLLNGVRKRNRNAEWMYPATEGTGDMTPRPLPVLERIVEQPTEKSQ